MQINPHLLLRLCARQLLVLSFGASPPILAARPGFSTPLGEDKKEHVDYSKKTNNSDVFPTQLENITFSYLYSKHAPHAHSLETMFKIRSVYN